MVLALLGYLLNGDPAVTQTDLEKAARRHPPTRKSFMTLAEHLRQEGRTEGRSQGRVEGRLEVLTAYFSKHFGRDFSRELKALPETAVVRLEGIFDEFPSSTALTKWLRENRR